FYYFLMYKSIDVMANWFGYMGGDIFTPGSYVLLGNGEPTGCTSGCIVCAIFLNDNNSIPTSIPGSVRAYLANAVAFKVNQPVGFPTYVRMKNCP
ncbi:hypothetical protein, partial [Pedobacter gandavensis]|uniref:hypothetical protein n=1 Tax=Pedobacter gandavensis TaxID=2679963 RepID=UPI00292E2EE9